jgi:uncharacterized membrane protein
MNKAINFAKKIGPVAFMWVVPALAMADSAVTPPPGSAAGSGGTVPTTGITSLQSILDELCVVFAWMFYFLIVVAVIFVIVAAFKYLTAGGDPEKVKSAGATLLYAAVAIGVALLAKAIPLIISNFLGASGVTSC